MKDWLEITQMLNATRILLEDLGADRVTEIPDSTQAVIEKIKEELDAHW